MRPALERVDRWRKAPLGTALETPLARNRDGLESPLGNLFADALRAAVPGADAAIGLGARRGGLRADLPRGPLTRGSLYDAYPFDNRVVALQLTGAQLERVLAGVVGRAPRGLPGVSGVRVRMACEEGRREVEVVRSSGVPVGQSEALIVATTDFLAGFAARVSRNSGLPLSETSLAKAPLVRNAVADWVTTRGSRLRAADLLTPPRWEAPDGGACLAAD
jgi:2',3'-cyclic-nucleotide 2'-phosphodiesterase (5'-nucleotidase family)